MPTVLISGANRGLGLEFASQYAGDGWAVVATVRDVGRADDLRATGAEVLPLDAADPASIASLAGAFGDRPLDLLVANAGVYGPREPEAEGWLHTLATNAVGPTLLALALRRHLMAGEGRKLVAITSQMGSIGDNGSGGSIAYRSSKAALNAAWRSLAIDWKADGLIVGLLHPGWVRTDMGGGGATLSPRQSVEGLRRVIGGLDAARSGGFYAHDGRELPW